MNITFSLTTEARGAALDDLKKYLERQSTEEYPDIEALDIIPKILMCDSPADEISQMFYEQLTIDYDIAKHLSVGDFIHHIQFMIDETPNIVRIFESALPEYVVIRRKIWYETGISFYVDLKYP